MKQKILIIEDNADVRENLREILTLSGYEAHVAANGKEGVEAALRTPPDLILCDIMMPELDGYGVLRILSKQATTSSIPFVFLTARTELGDMRRGMTLGADDYITKPFHLSELEARARAVLRRAQTGGTPEVVHGPLRLDIAGRRIHCHDVPMDLSVREFAVLELLLLRIGKVVTKQQIVEKLYGLEDTYASNQVEVFIYRLRKKLQPSGVNIRTIRGMGYLIEKTRGG